MPHSHPPEIALVSTRCVRICQNRTCRKQGAAQVLAAFQTHITAAAIANITVLESSCLGRCGNGPMVQVLPEQVWYCRVQPAEVPAVVERHLLHGQPVQAMLDPTMHPPSGASH